MYVCNETLPRVFHSVLLSTSSSTYMTARRAHSTLLLLLLHCCCCWSIVSTRGHRNDVSRDPVKKRWRLPEIFFPESLLQLFAGTARAIGSPTTEKWGRWIAVYITIFWNARRGICIAPESHASPSVSLTARFVCFVAGSTTRLLCPGGAENHGMLLSDLCKMYFVVAPLVAFTGRTT